MTDFELMKLLTMLITLHADPVHKEYQARLVDALETLVRLRLQWMARELSYCDLAAHRQVCRGLIAEGSVQL